MVAAKVLQGSSEHGDAGDVPEAARWWIHLVDTFLHFSYLFPLEFLFKSSPLSWALESVVQTEGRQLNCGAGDSYRPGLAACTEKQLWFPNCFWPTVRRSKMVRICPSNAEWSLALARISCGTGTPLMIYIRIHSPCHTWQKLAKPARVTQRRQCLQLWQLQPERRSAFRMPRRRRETDEVTFLLNNVKHENSRPRIKEIVWRPATPGAKDV